MPSSTNSNKQRSSILKRLSFRRPFARKQKRPESPVSVLDDEVFLLPKHDASVDMKEEIMQTFSSSSLEDEEVAILGGVSFMNELEAEAPASHWTDEHHVDQELQAASTTEKSPAPLEPDLLTKEVPEIDENEVVKEVAVMSMSRSECESSENQDDALKVGARVFINGGTYKNNHGIIEKIMQVKIQVAIDGKGSKRIDKKSVSAALTEAASSNYEEDSDITVPLVTACSEASDDVPTTTAGHTTPIAINHSTSFRVGQVVLIVKGDHKDQRGKITTVTDKMVHVSISGKVKTVRKRKTSVQPVVSEDSAPYEIEINEPIANTHMEESSSPVQSAVTSSASMENDRSSSPPPLAQQTIGSVATDDDHVVSITGGKYKSESGRVEEATDKTVKVYIESLGKSVRVKRSNTSIDGISAINGPCSSSRSSSAYPAGGEWHLPDSGTGGTRFGSLIIMKLRTQRHGAKRAEQNFLTHLFQDRLQVTETPMNQKEMEHPFDVNIIGEGGFGYELLSSKVQNDGDASSGPHCQAKCVRLVYAQVTGPQRTTYSLKQELCRLGDFASLSTRKVVARLELLQSPAYQFNLSGTKELGTFSLQRTDFVQFTHERNDGCGFISDDLLAKLCSRGGAAFAKRALALQIRAVIPIMGIFKGVLMRKRIPPGEPQIQLMPSMQKVEPSREANMDERAFLWITQQGMHPSQNNLMIGRLLDPNAKPPPKSFKPKRISDEILRLWRTLKVPQDICNAYAKKSVRARDLQHASVVGVADPTSSLPVGHVFVTGMKHLPQESLFVTRFPCNLPSDGRILQNVTHKPAAMSAEDWSWLNELPFGAIIFSDAEEGMKPLPEMVADGDLDGDLYFVCWNEEILKYIKPEEITSIPVDEEPTSRKESHPDENWLEKAQQQMIDAGKVYEMSELVGKLYNLAKAAAMANEELITRDPKAMSFAAAYKHALKHGKHGGAIPLDADLHEKLPPRLRTYLTIP